MQKTGRRAVVVVVAVASVLENDFESGFWLPSEVCRRPFTFRVFVPSPSKVRLNFVVPVGVKQPRLLSKPRLVSLAPVLFYPKKTETTKTSRFSELKGKALNTAESTHRAVLCCRAQIK